MNLKNNIMKKIINFCILFALYIYENYIYEDWSIYKPVGKIYYYPGWFYKSILTWLVCPIFLPEYLFKQTTIYKHIKKIQESPDYQAQLMKSSNYFKI